MSLFETIIDACRPNVYLMPPMKMYTFAKDGVPMNVEELEKATIETVLAESFDECFRKRPDLTTWFFVSVTK